jgi:hypothetical protein
MLDRNSDDWTRWLEEFSKGKDREAWRGIMCFLRWIQIRAINGHAIPNFLPGLEGDLFHSHLLRRLLEGKEPLPFPPPESYGGAWYEILESGKAEGVEVRPWEWAPDLKIAINEGIWTIVEKKSATEMLVTYREGGETFRLRRREDETWMLERFVE